MDTSSTYSNATAKPRYLRQALKICKYEFFMSRPLLLLGAFLVILACCSVFFDHDFGDFESSFSIIMGCAYLGFTAFYYFSITTSLYHGFFGRNALLTHSLPVSLDSVLLAKIGIFTLWSFIAALSFYVSYHVSLDFSGIESVRDTTFVILIALSGIVFEITYVFAITAIVSLLHSFRVIVGIILYFGCKILFLVAIMQFAEAFPAQTIKFVLHPSLIVIASCGMSIINYGIIRFIITRKLSL